MAERYCLYCADYLKGVELTLCFEGSISMFRKGEGN